MESIVGVALNPEPLPKPETFSKVYVNVPLSKYPDPPVKLKVNVWVAFDSPLLMKNPLKGMSPDSVLTLRTPFNSLFISKISSSKVTWPPTSKFVPTLILPVP